MIYLPIVSPIGASGADNGLHSLVVRTVGAIQNQHTRKSSPLTKDDKPPERESEKPTGRVCKNRPSRSRDYY